MTKLKPKNSSIRWKIYKMICIRISNVENLINGEERRNVMIGIWMSKVNNQKPTQQSIWDCRLPR